MTSVSRSTDVVILGGGPAGLAAAIALRQKDIPCLVVEALQPAIDKGCGEGLMPEALTALGELGIRVSEDDGHPFRGIRFVNPEHQVDACFQNGTGIGVRRTKLHQRILDRAHAVGVETMFGSRAKLLGDRMISVNGAPIQYRWLIGADGQASSVRKWAGLDATRKEGLRFGFRRHYKVAPWSEYVEIHWGPAGQVYVTPIASDAVCVVFITRDRNLQRENIFDDFPEIARRLQDAPVISKPRGAVSATRKLHRVANEYVALVGDASGSADSITGAGLAMSFRQAISLAKAIEMCDLKLYDDAHRAIGKLPHAMGSLMLMMDKWPSLERHAMKVLSAEPAFFHHLLGVHVGMESLSRFAWRQGPRVGWHWLLVAFTQRQERGMLDAAQS